MNNIARIIKYSWSLKRYYISTTILVIITSLLAQVTPFFLKFMVDGLDRSKNADIQPMSYFMWLLIGILVVNVITTIISNVQGFIGDKLGAKLNTLLGQRYYDHLLKLPLAYYDNELAGKITSRLERSINTIANLMNAFANNFVGFFLTAAITLIILAIYAWPVALLLAILFPFYIWLTTLSSRRWQKRQEGINRNIDINQGRFVESIGQIRAVKSFVTEAIESRFFAAGRRKIEHDTAEQSVGWHWYDVARRLGLNVIFFGIYAYIVIETVNGRYSLGDFTLLIQLVTQAQFPLFASSFIVDSIQRASAGSKDFFEVMALKPEATDQAGASALAGVKGHIRYQHIDFAYEAKHPVLQNISFDVLPGEKLALVGESGEGKTTVANLLSRFYEPTSGTIIIDDQDIAGVTQASLRASIGVVFQEPALFSGSVQDNISYGSPAATLKQIKAAAKAANASGFIEKLSKGYQTEIGERGVKLSGGQKQRIAIARAILKDAPILVLDEATSALDSKAEHEVQAALEVLMHGRTSIIIAHRLSTIARVDKIVSLRGGKIIEAGTPAQLAKSGGLYAELLQLQNSGLKLTVSQLAKYDLAAESQ